MSVATYMAISSGGTTVSTDTTAPSLTHAGLLSVSIDGTAVITSALLRFDDNVSPHDQETYTVSTAPQHGTLLKNGVATSSFTQADIDNGLISYQAGSTLGADSFKFSVADASGNTTTVFPFGIQVIDAPPTITGAEDEQPTTEGVGLAPFAGVIIADADTPSANENVTVTLDDPAKGTLSNLGGGTYDAGTGVYSVSGTAATVTAALEGLIFTPALHRVTPGLTETTAFTITVKAGLATVTDSHTSVVATSVEDAPSIVSNGGGDSASLSIPENSTAVTTIVATDPDVGQTLTYSIVGGADQAVFQIDPSTGILSFITPPDFEAPGDADGNNTYIVEVQAWDGLLADTQTLSVSVTDVPGVILSQTGAKLAKLTPADIAALAGQEVVQIDATDNVLRLTVAQYLALGTVKLTPSDVVTLGDTGAALAALSASAFGALAANGIDIIDATDNVLALTMAQLRSLNGVALTAKDVVTLRDSGANLATAAPTEIAALAGLGVEIVDATDDVLVLSLAQFNALGNVQLTAADLVILRDTGANLAALTAGQITALAGKRIDRLDASDGALTLTTAQFKALGSVQLDPADIVTLADTGAALAALTPVDIGALSGKGIEILDASDNTLTLSVAQYQALGALMLTAADVVTLADTGAVLAAMSAANIAALAGRGIDRLDATDNALTLTLAQFQALGPVTLTAADVVTLTGSSSALGGLSTASLAALAGAGIDRIDATNDLLTLNLAQLQALGAVVLTAADVVTLADTGANLAAQSPAAIAGLAGKGIDRINASDNALSLTLAQFQALGAVALTPSNVVTLVGSSTTLGALSVTDIAALAGKGIDRLDSNNDLLTFNVAQAEALGPVALTAADLVSLADTGAALAALAPAAIAALASKGFDRIHVTDGPLTLNVAQVQALGAMVLAPADVVILADTGAALAALPPAIIAGLAAKGIDRIDATDNVLTLSVAQALALGTVALTASDMVTLADTGNHLKALTAAQIGVLAKSIDFMDATDNVLTLSLAQYQALGAMVLAAADVVTIADTGAALAGMSTSGFAALAGKGIDRLDATDDALTLTLAQYQALGTVVLTAADVVTLKASPSAIVGLGISGLAALAGKGIDVIDSSTDVLTLNVAQYLALGPVICAAADVVTVADTGANLAGMPLANFAALAGHGIDRIDATDNLLTLSAAQAVALGPVALTAADLITLADTGANLGGIPASVFATLATNGADRMDATDNTLTLSVAQFQALGGIALTAADVVTLADTGATLTALSPAAIAALPGKGIDGLDATDNQLSLSLAQYQALGPLTLSAGDVVTLTDTGAALTGLSPADMAALAGRGIDRLDSTTDALTLSVAQYVALGPVTLAAADVVTLADTGANLSALSVADIAALAGHGIDHIDATDNGLSFSLAQFNALGTTTLSADDALTLTGTADSDTIGFTSQPFNVHDRIDGGLGTDTLTLAGDYSAGLAFEPGTIANLERILLNGGNSYKFTEADANVAAGQTLIVNGAKLGAGNSLVFDGSAETNGKFSLVGGAGSNTFTGGNGADSITAGSGADLIRYTAASQSTSTNYDTVAGFDAAKDKFQVPGAVTGVDPTITTGRLSAATFDADLASAANAVHLLANHAVLFTPDSGNQAGAQFLVVDTNGMAGYQGGSDLVIRLTGATNLGAFGTGNFS